MSAPECGCGHQVWTHDTRAGADTVCYVEGCTCPRYDGIVHVLLPNMSYACGGDILTKEGASTAGVDPGWDRVTCPDCRRPGREYLRAVQAWMQGHGEHPDDRAVVHHVPAAGASIGGEQSDLFGGAA